MLSFIHQLLAQRLFDVYTACFSHWFYFYYCSLILAATVGVPQAGFYGLGFTVTPLDVAMMNFTYIGSGRFCLHLSFGTIVSVEVVGTLQG